MARDGNMRRMGGRGVWSVGVACGFAMAMGVAGGCKNPGSGVFSDERWLSARNLEGTWRGKDGSVYEMDATAGGGLRVTTPEGTRLNAMIFRVSGQSVLEVPLSDRAQMAPEALPVYHYARLTLRGDTLWHEPLDPAWCAGECAGAEGLAVSALASGRGGEVTVGDSEAMRRLLEKAVATPAAWGEREVLVRE